MTWTPPNDLDPEVLDLSVALNALPGIETYESCCGHGQLPYRIWFVVTDYSNRGLLTLSRLLCRNYYRHRLSFRVELDHKDTAPQLCFCLEGIRVEGARIAQMQSERLAKDITTHVEGRTGRYNILLDRVDEEN